MSQSNDDSCTAALFGDSITQMSYFSDALYESCAESYAGKMAIWNCGIGGNRFLHDACRMPEMPGEGNFLGKAGINRFQDDIFAEGVPEYVFFWRVLML